MASDDEDYTPPPEEVEKRAHQRSVLKERISEAIKAKKENWDRRDAEKKGTELNRSLERSRQREHSKEMYDQRRSDQFVDREINAVGSLEAEQEKTNRELLLTKLGAEIYKHRLDDDFNDFVRRSNIDLQGYKIRTQIDTVAETDVIRTTNYELRREIRTRLKSQIIETLTSHVVSIREKREDGKIEQERMILENELKKDFELFMFELRQNANNKSTEEISDILSGLESGAF